MTRKEAEKLAIKLGLSTWDQGDDGFGGEDVPDKKAIKILMDYSPNPSPAPEVMGTQWSAQDYQRECQLLEAAERITKRLTEHAIRIEWTRADLISDSESTEDECVADAISVAMGEDTGCLDPDALDATNCEILFVQNELRKLAQPAPWVDVKVGLPKDEVAKLVFVQDTLCHHTAYYDGCDWLSFEPNGRSTVIWGVTHWREIQNDIPAPPETRATEGK